MEPGTEQCCGGMPSAIQRPYRVFEHLDVVRHHLGVSQYGLRIGIVQEGLADGHREIVRMLDQTRRLGTGQQLSVVPVDNLADAAGANQLDDLGGIARHRQREPIPACGDGTIKRPPQMGQLRLEGHRGNGPVPIQAGMQGIKKSARGLSLGDVIVAINDTPVNGYDDLYNTLDRFNAGDVVKVWLQRGDKRVSADLTLIEIP